MPHPSNVLSALSHEQIDRVDVLGVDVSAITIAQALAVMDTWIATRNPHYVCVADVHRVMESQRNERLRQIHNAAGLVTPDGMPLVWLARRHGFTHVERVYGPDLMDAACLHSLYRRYSHFFFGGAEGVANRLASRLACQYPGLRVAGTYTPSARESSPAVNSAIVDRINRAAPDIVWVGLETPMQEQWMHEHVGLLEAPVLIGVGPTFDLHAGLKRQAPKWMQRRGLEWLFRLANEPLRLGPRYLVDNPTFMWRVARTWSRLQPSQPPHASA